MQTDHPDGDETPESYPAAYVAQIKQAAERRVIAAELKAQALAAGMVDPDGLKLLDTGTVCLDEEGRLSLPDGFFEKARKEKPYLFAARHAASVAKAPEGEPMRTLKATEMSTEQWKAARADLLRRL